MTKTTIKTETTTCHELEIQAVYIRETSEDWDYITVEINYDGWGQVDENSFGRSMKAAERWAAKAVARLVAETEAANA